jgi:hypothetical protein
MIRQLIFICAFLLCKQLFGQSEFSTGVETLNAGNTTIVFRTSCAGELPGIQFIHVHENEQTAVQVAYQMLEKYGRGCFVTWQSRGDRYINFKLDNSIYKFDPNRIYTARGRKETLTANGEYSEEADSIVENIAKTFLAGYIDDKHLIVALHNNTDDGGLTINSFKKGGDYARDAKKVHINKKRDKDDFFLTTDLLIYNFIKSRGFNILLQNNDQVTDDGSLSVYAASKKIPYLNIEAQHDHLKQQLEMMDVVQEMIQNIITEQKFKQDGEVR